MSMGLGQVAVCPFRRCLIMSDGAKFCLDGSVSKQNARVWGIENPHATHEQEGQSPPVRCATWTRGIPGPFFVTEKGRPATLTGVQYHALLRDKGVPGIKACGVPLPSFWFQRDGATPHTARTVLHFLETTFHGKVSLSMEMWRGSQDPRTSPYQTFGCGGTSRVKGILASCALDQATQAADSRGVGGRASFYGESSPQNPTLPPSGLPPSAGRTS